MQKDFLGRFRMTSGWILRQRKAKRQTKFTNHFFVGNKSICGNAKPIENLWLLRETPTALPGCRICRTCEKRKP